MLEETTRSREPVEAAPPRPDGSQRTAPRPRWILGSRGVIAILATWLVLGVAFARLDGDLSALRSQLADTRSTSGTTDERLSGVASAEASLSARLGDLFDPAAVVGGAEPSVFTVVAGTSLGSAFVIRSSGDGSLLVTNFHVVRSVWTAGVRVIVVRSGSRSFNARIGQVRPDADLAILQVASPLPPLNPNAGRLDVGQQIVVIGSPYGYGGTASTGIVSSVRARFVQFSAPVSPGSSGGPVLDGDGQVIGVATAKVVGPGAEGLSFAIPIGLVCRQTAAC